MKKVVVILLLFIVAYSFSACRSQNELQLESSSQPALELESGQKEPAENTQEYFLLYRSILPLSGGKKWIRDLKKYLRDL